MKKRFDYIKHQAFDIVHKELKVNSGRVDGFDAPKKYHHDPTKLDVFKDFTHYVWWGNELHRASSILIDELTANYNKSTRARSSFFTINAERKINDILQEFYIYDLSLQNLREDILEFQICMLSTHISEKNAEIEALSEQLRYLLSLEDRIINTCNRKLYEISSSRMSFYSLIVAGAAIVVSLVSNLK